MWINTFVSQFMYWNVFLPLSRLYYISNSIFMIDRNRCTVRNNSWKTCGNIKKSGGRLSLNVEDTAQCTCLHVLPSAAIKKDFKGKKSSLLNGALPDRRIHCRRRRVIVASTYVRLSLPPTLFNLTAAALLPYGSPPSTSSSSSTSTMLCSSMARQFKSSKNLFRA